MSLTCHRRHSAAERTALLHHLLFTHHLAEHNARAVLLRLEECTDPIDVLVTRMRIDHQLDDNALRAIDDDARRRARCALKGTLVLP